MKHFIYLFLICCPGFLLFGQTNNNSNSQTRFMFHAGSDSLFLQGNEAEFQRLYNFVEEHRALIVSGEMPVKVDGYSTTLPTDKENLNLALLRTKRVKSELITHKGLREEHFITATYHQANSELSNAVVVTMVLPQPKPQPEPRPQIQEPRPEPKPETPPAVVVEEEEEAPVVEELPTAPYHFAIRTNLAYDALLLPTLGIEWRINRNVGIKVDGGYAYWGTKHGKIQKMWFVNPEVRKYICSTRRAYIGVGGNIGEANLYKYVIGSLISGQSGFQGKFWNAGVTGGYQLPLSKAFLFDFNIGVGYNHFNYDKFSMENGERVMKRKNCSKAMWGITQAAVALVYSF